MVLVGVLVALTVQGGGQTIVAVLPVPLVSGQGGGHVGVVPVCAQGGGHDGAPPVAVPAGQGAGQTGCGWTPVAVVLVTQGGTHRTAGQAAPGGQLGGGGQGGSAHEDPAAHGAGHSSDFAGTRRVRVCLMAWVPCRLRVFDRPWR